MTIGSITAGLRRAGINNIDRNTALLLNFALVRGGSRSNKIQLIQSLGVANAEALINNYNITPIRMNLATNQNMEVASRSINVSRPTAARIKEGIAQRGRMSDTISIDNFVDNIINLIRANTPDAVDAWGQPIVISDGILEEFRQRAFPILKNKRGSDDLETGLSESTALVEAPQRVKIDDGYIDVMTGLERVIENSFNETLGLGTEPVVIYQDDEGKWQKASKDDFERHITELGDEILDRLRSVGWDIDQYDSGTIIFRNRMEMVNGG